MILYSANKLKFIDDVMTNRIEEIVEEQFLNKLRRKVGQSERTAWKNSLAFMHRVVDTPELPDDSGVGIEFKIPLSDKRIDFVLTGLSPHSRRTAVIVELKQWSEAGATDMDAIVTTVLQRAVCETNHPSYQAWSYSMMLSSFNEAIEKENVSLLPCAYLHNCPSDTSILDPRYQWYTERAPVFFQADALKLREFLCKHVKYGDACETLFLIECGRIRPSKFLADSLKSMLKGNRDFLLIDDQKLVFETAKRMAREAQDGDKGVLIVKGGPGTGKSVIAINLLVNSTTEGMNARYVSRNAAPRAVFESMLTGTFTKSHISNMFSGSGGFYDTEPDTFDALIVDEAHRLNEKSGLYQNQGENQIKELIGAAKFCVFFIDEDQRVTLRDVGEASEIRYWAQQAKANIVELELQSQFRCNGSDGYLAWIDNLLDIRETANTTLEGIHYDIRVCDSPTELRLMIEELNSVNNKSRMVAGYCWDWKSKTNPGEMDIVLEDGKFAARWNLTQDGSLWIVKPNSVKEIGCIHTCQGLEVDYIGVLLGEDLVVRDGKWICQPEKRSKMDSSVRGWKQLKKTNPELASDSTERIIKNTYRTLMTRGQKGCFLYSVDAETNKYLADAVGAKIGEVVELFAEEILMAAETKAEYPTNSNPTES